MAPEVETRHGRLRGEERDGVRIFRGVRYAAAPRGALRFQPPRPPEPWTGVLDARRPGPAAPQFALPWFGWISAAGVPPGQDCLSLNVFTPGLDGARRPVVVWIHGGGFMVGSGATPVYDGRELARRRDVVVVTINYRLGALGFVHLGTVFGEGFGQSSNLGVRDQIAALEWVREHADRFGGDPENVTVVGQSAGAMSIGALLGSPAARRLFHRAVLQSGAAGHVVERSEAELTARAFLSELGGPPPSHEALGRIRLRTILNAQRRVMQQLQDWNRRLMVFLPCVDGDVIPEQPLAAVARGEARHIPLLVGTTLDEWKLFRAVDPGVRGLSERDLESRFTEVLASHRRAPAPAAAVREFRAALQSRGAALRPNEVWSAFQSARIMHLPARRLADAHAAAEGCTHGYLFSWRLPGPLGRFGAFHGLEIPFVFGTTQHPLARPLTGLSSAASRLTHEMQHAWGDFARSGGSNGRDGPPWPVSAPPQRTTMVFGPESALVGDPLAAEAGLLERWTAA